MNKKITTKKYYSTKNLQKLLKNNKINTHIYNKNIVWNKLKVYTIKNTHKLNNNGKKIQKQQKDNYIKYF